MSTISEQQYKALKSELETTKLLYNNLLANFYRISDYILGDDYYNLGSDVYTSHTMTADDIIKQYNDDISLSVKIARVINDIKKS